MVIKEHEYDLVFVEKKTPTIDENDIQFERLGYELNVLNDDGDLLIPMYDGLVDREDLFRLAAAISDNCSDANEFFNSYLGNRE